MFYEIDPSSQSYIKFSFLFDTKQKSDKHSSLIHWSYKDKAKKFCNIDTRILVNKVWVKMSSAAFMLNEQHMPMSKEIESSHTNSPKLK